MKKKSFYVSYETLYFLPGKIFYPQYYNQNSCGFPKMFPLFFKDAWTPSEFCRTSLKLSLKSCIFLFCHIRLLFRVFSCAVFYFLYNIFVVVIFFKGTPAGYPSRWMIMLFSQWLLPCYCSINIFFMWHIVFLHFQDRWAK